MTSSSILDIFRNQLEQHAVVHIGNYNPQDTTSFKNMYAFVELTVKVGDSSEYEPEQQVWKITLDDNSWGEDFKIQNCTTRHLKHQVIEGYFCQESSYNRNMDGCIELITDILTAATWFKHEKQAMLRVDELQDAREDEEIFTRHQGPTPRFQLFGDTFDSTNA